MSDRMKVGISTCLLGKSVRYDGGHKLDRYLRDELGPYVNWVSVCPEVECGMTIPRESMRLQGSPETPRLVTSRSGKDLTEQMQGWIQCRLDELAENELCGFIFKHGSPSSGMRGIKVYTEKGMPSNRGVGMFARAFMERFPLVPVEDDGRLNDAQLRENFIERIFVMHRWYELSRSKLDYAGLVNFHTDHKLLIMAHSPKQLKSLGQLVADGRKRKLGELRQEYIEILMPTLALRATIRKNVNVLQHVMGYFKKQLTADEKKELQERIDDYYRELVPLVVPLVLLQHYVRKYEEKYLQRQYYLHPHPTELRLRNHV